MCPLCHGNSGKYLTKRFHELRDMARDDLTALSADEQSFAETSTLPYVNMNQPGAHEIETQPMEWYDTHGYKFIDSRVLKDPTFDTKRNTDRFKD